MPRVDHLVDQNYIEKTKLKLLNKYPLLKIKRLFYMHQHLEEIFIKE